MVTAAAIRLGTILALGRMHGTLRAVLAVVSGTALGVGAVIACRGLGLWLLHRAETLEGAGADGLESLAILLLPVVVGLAATLAASDRGHPPVTGDLGRPAALGLGGALLLVIVLVAVSAPPSAVSELAQLKTIGPILGPDKGEKSVPEPILIGEVPVAVEIDIRFGHRVVASLPERWELIDGSNPPDFYLEIWKRGGDAPVTTQDDPPVFDLVLEPWVYLLVVTTLGRSSELRPGADEAVVSFEGIFPALAARLTSIGASVEAAREIPTEDLGLKAPLRIWLNASPPEGALEGAILADSPAGPVGPGSVVVCRKPADLKEDSGWFSEMDAYVGTPLTIRSLHQRSETFQFEVWENPHTWDVRWIESVASAPDPDAS
jgi:hypothetical protein